MRLTATQIREQQFAMKLFRGFVPGEVDAFLEEIADDVEELTRENEYLKEQLARLEDKNRGAEGREKTLQETLVTTQKIAEEFKDNARREGELILREAHLRAEKFIQDAREEHAKLTAEVNALRRQRRQLGEELLGIANTHKRLVEQLLAEGDGAS
jgi:cell division initiation protein